MEGRGGSVGGTESVLQGANAFAGGRQGQKACGSSAGREMD